MTFEEVKEHVKQFGTEQNRKIYKNHGCDIPLYGVSMKHLKDTYRLIKKETTLFKELLFSSNADLIYLSQWGINPSDVSDEELDQLIASTEYYLILENVIPYVLIKDEKRALRFVYEYLDSNHHKYKQIAYTVYSLLLKEHQDILDMEHINQTVQHVSKTLHNEVNRVKYTMNQFLISVGVYIKEQRDSIYNIGLSLGYIHVDMGKTSCKVPSITTYMDKVTAREQKKNKN